MNTGMSLSNNISVDIGVVSGSDSDGSIDLRLTLFSSTLQWGSIALLYKGDLLDEWHENAIITFSQAKFLHENEMYGLPCSANGSESRLTWNYASNGLSMGSRCIVRAVVIPSLGISCATDEYSRIENLFKGGDKIIGTGIPGNIIGMDSFGNYVTIGDHHAYVVDVGTGETILSSEWLNRPVSAVGMQHGGLLILDTNGMLTEIDNEGNLLRTFDASSMALGEYATVAHHSATGNILLAGGDIAVVSELAWGGQEYGTVLWSYSGVPFLSIPTGAIYGDNLSTVLLCDSGNNRVVVVDRSYATPLTTSLSSVTISGQTLALVQPIRCAISNGTIYVCEAKGRVEEFGMTLSSHPALARVGIGTPSGINTLEQFAGMCFVPIVRSIK